MKIIKIKYTAILLILFFLKITSVTFTYSQESSVNWWEPQFEKGLQSVRDKNYPEAEAAFRSILEKEKNIAEAHFGLGLLFNSKEPGSKEAEDQLKKAIDLKADYAEAYSLLGTVYLNMGNKLQDAKKNFLLAIQKNSKFEDAWSGLGETEKTLGQSGPAMNAFKEALLLSPENQQYYISFLEMTYRNSNATQVLEALNDLRKQFPDNPEFDLALANIYFRLNDFALCAATLETIKKKYSDFPPSRMHLLQAKVYFEHGETTNALSYYWSAINTIRDEKDAQAVFDDVCYLMNNDEYIELQATPVEKIWNFYYRFWRKRDPNLTTKENERLVEHYQRLLFAFKNYRRYATQDIGMKFVYASAHPYYQYNVMGDDFWAESFWPAALPKDREIDDLGLIYIRHGEPDLKITSLNGSSIFEDPTGLPHWEEDPNLNRSDDSPVIEAPGTSKETMRAPQPTKGERLTGLELRKVMPQNLSWKYFEKDGRKEMIFHFEKHGGTLGWIIEAIPFVPADRHELHPELQQLEQSSYSPLTSPRARSVESSRFSNIVKTNAKRFAKIALTTETTNFEFKKEKFEFPYKFLSFKGKNGQNLVELYYMIEGFETKLMKSEQGGSLDLTKYVGFFDNKWEELVALNRRDKINLAITPMEWNNFSIVDVERFNIIPGNYNIEIQFHENTSDKIGSYKGIFQNINYDVDQLMLSDVIVSTQIQPLTKESKFSKINIKYDPKMFSAFSKGSTVGIYFEIYNLTGNAQLETNFRVSCTLKPFAASRANLANKITALFKNLTSDDEGTIGTSYDYQGQTRDERLYLNFQLEEGYTGRYELEVEVDDLNAQTKATKSISITITS